MQRVAETVSLLHTRRPEFQSGRFGLGPVICCIWHQCLLRAEIDILSGAGECQLSTIGERKPTIPFRPHNSFMMMMMGMP